jgi:pyruvate kinase
MSHGSHEEIMFLHSVIRALEAESGHPIAILADLQGPKFRCGEFASGRETIESGQRFRFDLDKAPGDSTRVCLPHPEILAALEAGSHILVNDGNLKLVVGACGAHYADCTVAVGGEISNRKGVNVPDVVLPLPALSRKNLVDLEFVCSLVVDWLAHSFVRRAAEVPRRGGW